MKKHIFEPGQNYEMRFIGDSDLRPVFTCVSRTEKSAKFIKANGSEMLIRKLRFDGQSEYILNGNYSMAPSITAKNIVKS